MADPVAPILPPECLAYDTEVVSPELPCGASWLANCLLELDVPVWCPWGLQTLGEWDRLGARRYRYAARELPWRQALPSLTVGREFRFEARPVPRFSHAWPAANASGRPVVLFVRDPRDALYSEWRRQVRNGGPAATSTFPAFLATRYYHHPFSYVEYLARFLDAWRAALPAQPSLLVHFEDYKADPIQTLERVTAFLGCVSDAERISIAVLRSDFSVLRQIEDELAAKCELQRQFNRSGTAFEFRQSFTGEMHAAIGTRFDSLCDWLGYELA